MPGRATSAEPVVPYTRGVIPLRDVIPSRTTPFVTIGIIAVNALAFLFELSLAAPARQVLFREYGIVPAALVWPTLLSSMFLHGGWLHVIGNMWFLWIFGDNVEDRLGHGRYLAFYLLAGMVAGMAQALVSPDSYVPTIGASGAIAGVMGAYFVLYPFSRVLTLVWLFVFVDIVEIPAVFFLGFWFLMQLFSGVGSVAQTAGSHGGIAFWAHVAGFLFGVAAVFVFRRPERQRVDWWHR
jgi:membrane associated rhomboid family serine protease